MDRYAARPEPLDLHAFVDGRLAADRRTRVLGWCESDPAEARRLAGWARDAALLRNAFDPVLDEPLPSTLQPRRPKAISAEDAAERSAPALRTAGVRRSTVIVAVASFLLGAAAALSGAALVRHAGAAPPELVRSLWGFFP